MTVPQKKNVANLGMLNLVYGVPVGLGDVFASTRMCARSGIALFFGQSIFLELLSLLRSRQAEIPWELLSQRGASS